MKPDELFLLMDYLPSEFYKECQFTVHLVHRPLWYKCKRTQTTFTALDRHDVGKSLESAIFNSVSYGRYTSVEDVEVTKKG